MALKKSQLYSSLWQSCDELRGGMDASQYKDYVLTLLFMKYVSDKYAGSPDALIEVPAGGGFADMVKLKGDKEIGDKINKIISELAGANELKGVIDQADFNDESKLGTGKEMQDRLSKLVAIFDGLDFRANRTEGDDLLGDAYEYLMQHFATESGKSKGQFYTPAEVSRIMAQVIGIGPDTRSDHKYKTDLIPPTLIVARWFAAQQSAIEKLQGAQKSAARELEEFVEEHSSSGGGDDGLLADAANDRGRVTSAAVKQRLKTIRGEPENDEERDILMRCLALIEADSEAGKAVKGAQAAMDRAVLARYATLTEAEIKTLVVEDKWYASIRAAIDDEVQRLTQRLTRRVQELEQRYARPLPALEQEVEVFSAKIERHLKRMGVPQ